MTETPREYKKRVDETREKRRKNRDKFFEYLQEYELVDERFKAKTRQEILANFEKNEKAEKGSELYTKIGKELDTIEKKYKSLEELKAQLEPKIKEKAEIVDKIRGFSMNRKDETTLNLQRAEMKKLESEMKKLEEEINEIKKSIKEREDEIKETEETYGKKIEENIENQVIDEEPTENKDDTPTVNGETVTRPISLLEYRKLGVLKKLVGINHTRHEIIKLLNDGIGVDDEIKKRIEDEVSKKFFDYYDEKQGTLRMKAAQSIGIRRNIYEIKNEEYEYKGYIGYIGGKPVFKAKKDGKWCIMWGNEQCSDWCDNIRKPQDVGGKPCFRAQKDGKKYIMWGNKQYSDRFDDIGDLKEIGGRPCFRAQKDGKKYIMWGNKQYSDRFDDIGDLKEIGGKPCFKAKKDGKLCVMRGNEKYSDWFDFIGDLKEIGGKPCLRAKKDGERCIIWGKEQYSDWFDSIGEPIEIGGKPCFRAKKDGERCIIWGKEQQGEWFDEIEYIKEIGGKPCFEAIKEGKHCIIWGDKQIGNLYHNIYDIQEIGGKPCFLARKNDGRGLDVYCIIRGNEEYSGWYRNIEYIQEVGGKPCFIVQKDYRYCVIRGKEQYSKWYEKIEEVKEIGGKPAFKSEGVLHFQKEIGGKTMIANTDSEGYCNVTRGGKYCGNIRYEKMGEVKEIGGKPLFWVKNNCGYHIIRGDKVYAGGFDSIDIYGEIGGEPIYYVKKKNKRYLMLGKEEYIDLNEKKFDSISDLNVIGGKIFYIAHRKGGQFFMIGKQQYTYRCDEIKILNINEKEGTVTIASRIEDKNEIITFHINEVSDNGENDTVIDDTQKPQENGSLDSKRGQREKIILERYEKLLNIKELIKYLKENNILEKSEFSELAERLTENFFENYEKAKEDENFKAADEEYKKLKELKKKYRSTSKELKLKLGKNNEKLEAIKKQMMEIADDAIDIESGVSIKRLMLSRVKKEREKLDAQKKNISTLKFEKYKLKKKIEEQYQAYGPKIDRRKLKGKSEEELKRLLNMGNVTQVKTLKEYKEKHMEIIENYEKILGFIKNLDLGISEELKNEIISKIEKYIQGSIKAQEGGDILKMANDTEKYLEENLENIIKKLKELNKQIEEIEEKIIELEEKRKTANDDDLIKINDEIFEIGQQQIRLKNEYNEIKKTTNEKLHKYDGSDIEIKL